MFAFGSWQGTAGSQRLQLTVANVGTTNYHAKNFRFLKVGTRGSQHGNKSTARCTAPCTAPCTPPCTAPFTAPLAMTASGRPCLCRTIVTWSFAFATIPLTSCSTSRNHDWMRNHLDVLELLTAARWFFCGGETTDFRLPIFATVEPPSSIRWWPCALQCGSPSRRQLPPKTWLALVEWFSLMLAHQCGFSSEFNWMRPEPSGHGLATRF